MNEMIFFLHIGLLLAFTAIALKVGRSALFSLAVLQILLANLFVTKQIVLFGFHVTPTDAYTLGCLLASNLLQEYYGKEEARKLLRVNIFTAVFFIALSLIQLGYRPSPHDGMQGAFEAVLITTPRIFFASFLSFYLAQRIDIELFGRLRKRFSLGKAMAVSIACMQAVDTVLFSILALAGSVHSLRDIILVSYLMKMVALAVMTPFTKLLTKVRRADEV